MRIARYLWLGLVLAWPVEAAAQPWEPLAPIVVDARGSFVRFKGEAAVAGALGVQPDNLPTRGLGIGAGAHWYPLRGQRVALGVGAELLVARDTRTAEQTTTSTAPRPTVTTRLSAFSPQLSLNFGHRDGWSYVSGGIGSAGLTSEREDEPLAGSGERTRAIHYGGGARWFTGPHVAFSVDLRFYTVSAQPATNLRPGYPRSKIMVISAGISVH